MESTRLPGIDFEAWDRAAALPARKSPNRLLRPIRNAMAAYRRAAAMSQGLKPLRFYRNWIVSNIEMLARTSRIRARPLKLTIDPTNFCQLRCPLCPTGLQMPYRKRGHIDLSLVHSLLEDIGDYVFLIDFFNWGEPFINPHLEELVAAASNKRILSAVSSHLSIRIPDERIERIIANGLTWLICSIDGTTQDTYSRYRRGGRLEVALENMRRFVRIRDRMGRKAPAILWQFLVFGFNEHQCEDARRMAADIGVDHVVFLPPYLDTARYVMPPADAAEISGWAPKSEAFNRYGRAAGLERMPSRCDWHYMSSAINVDGSVAPCDTLHDSGDDFGNLGDHRYMDILNNEKYVAIRSCFNGRGSRETGLVCERCPTPSIMRYVPHVNRRVLQFLAIGLAEAIRKASVAVFWPPILRRSSKPSAATR